MKGAEKERVIYHFRVNGHLCKSLAFAPDQRVRLVAEQGFPYSSRRDAQEVTVPQGLHTLLLRSVDHTKHFQEELKPCHYTENRSTIKVKLKISTELVCDLVKLTEEKISKGLANFGLGIVVMFLKNNIYLNRFK